MGDREKMERSEKLSHETKRQIVKTLPQSPNLFPKRPEGKTPQETLRLRSTTKLKYRLIAEVMLKGKSLNKNIITY